MTGALFAKLHLFLGRKRNPSLRTVVRPEHVNERCLRLYFLFPRSRLRKPRELQLAARYVKLRSLQLRYLFG